MRCLFMYDAGDLNTHTHIDKRSHESHLIQFDFVFVLFYFYDSIQIISKSFISSQF